MPRIIRRLVRPAVVEENDWVEVCAEPTQWNPLTAIVRPNGFDSWSSGFTYYPCWSGDSEGGYLISDVNTDEYDFITKINRVGGEKWTFQEQIIAKIFYREKDESKGITRGLRFAVAPAPAPAPAVVEEVDPAPKQRIFVFEEDKVGATIFEYDGIEKYTKRCHIHYKSASCYKGNKLIYYGGIESIGQYHYRFMKGKKEGDRKSLQHLSCMNEEMRGIVEEYLTNNI